MSVGDQNHFMIGCRAYLTLRLTGQIPDWFVRIVGVESDRIGDCNTFEPRSKASSGVIITDHCTLCPSFIILLQRSYCSFTWYPVATKAMLLPAHWSTPQTLPPYTVVFGDDSDRRTWDRSSEVTEQILYAKHTEYLREVIPKYVNSYC